MNRINVLRHFLLHTSRLALTSYRRLGLPIFQAHWAVMAHIIVGIVRDWTEVSKVVHWLRQKREYPSHGFCIWLYLVSIRKQNSKELDILQALHLSEDMRNVNTFSSFQKLWTQVVLTKPQFVSSIIILLSSRQSRLAYCEFTNQEHSCSFSELIFLH